MAVAYPRQSPEDDPRSRGGQVQPFTSPAAPLPVEGETERCASCGRGPGYVAVSYDGGATVKRECVRTDCRATEPAPPVGGVQPEETDTVNDESKLGPHLRNAVTLAAMELRQRDVAVDIARRVEWGVRYRWHSSVLNPQRLREKRVLSEEMARDEVRKMRQMPSDYSDAEVVSRTVTTSPWVLVTDDAAGADR